MGTILDGNQAVESGLIDSLGGLSDAVKKLYELIDQREAARETVLGADSQGDTDGMAPTQH